MSGNVGIFLNMGDGEFTSQITYQTDSSPISVAVNDMNNDNYPDIIVAHMKSLGVLYIDCP
jgi:hypothetical protein